MYTRFLKGLPEKFSLTKWHLGRGVSLGLPGGIDHGKVREMSVSGVSQNILEARYGRNGLWQRKH